MTFNIFLCPFFVMILYIYLRITIKILLHLLHLQTTPPLLAPRPHVCVYASAAATAVVKVAGKRSGQHFIKVQHYSAPSLSPYKHEHAQLRPLHLV